MKDGDTVVNELGAKQSFTSADFNCIPAVVLRLLAQCLGFGKRKYGFENWKGISIEENLSHAMNHINEWRLGDRSEPHLVNAIARLSFALWHAVDKGEQAHTYVHPDQMKPVSFNVKPLEMAAVFNEVRQQPGMVTKCTANGVSSAGPLGHFGPNSANDIQINAPLGSCRPYAVKAGTP